MITTRYVGRFDAIARRRNEFCSKMAMQRCYLRRFDERFVSASFDAYAARLLGRRKSLCGCYFLWMLLLSFELAI